MAAGSKSVEIWWIRRDLRLHDNRALRHARECADSVIPLFILDPNLLESRYHANVGPRRSFLFAGLRSLDAALQSRGSRLIVRRGDPGQVLSLVMAETGAQRIVAEQDFGPCALRRDRAVSRDLSATFVPGVALRLQSPISRGWHGATIRLSSERGRKVSRAIPWSTRACGSFPPPVGCTTGLA